MCGRYEFNIDGNIPQVENIIRGIDEKYPEKYYKTGEIFPTDRVPILYMKDGKASLTLMDWGFNKWDGKGVIINARSETAGEKSVFMNSLMNKRCVILSTGFYEWKENNKDGDKFLFTREYNDMLYMAGLYEEDIDGNKNFVILTKDSNYHIKDIHHRMPVLLDKNELIDWLTDGRFVNHVFERDSERIIRELVK